MNNGTTVVSCKCDHQFQDKRYGVGQRLANVTQKQTDKTVDVRCTVCKKIHQVNKSAVK